jgi:hypothetical protein
VSARCVLDVASDLVEAEPVAVPNCEPGSNCAAVADRNTVTHNDHDADSNVGRAAVRATSPHRALRTK